RTVLRIGEGRVELAQHGLLLVAQANRRLDGDMRVEIARIRRAQPFDSLAAQPEGLAGLGAFRQFDLGPPGQGGHPHFTAERRGCHGDGNLAMEVIAIALEYCMLPDPDLDEEIPGRATIDARLAIAGRADAHAVLDPGRYVDLEGLLLLDAPLPVARRAWLGNHLAAAMAGRAGLLDRKEPLLDPNTALAIAGMARLGLGARLRARTLACGAAIPGRHANLGDVAVGGLLERDLHRVTQVGAAIDVVAPGSGTTGAEDVAEDVAKDIREATGATGSREAARIGVDAGMAEAVVGLALGRLGQDLVGFLDLLELGLGRLVVRIAVGMVLHREFPIGLLQVIGGRVLR